MLVRGDGAKAWIGTADTAAAAAAARSPTDAVTARNVDAEADEAGITKFGPSPPVRASPRRRIMGGW